MVTAEHMPRWTARSGLSNAPLSLEQAPHASSKYCKLGGPHTLYFEGYYPRIPVNHDMDARAVELFALPHSVVHMAQCKPC